MILFEEILAANTPTLIYDSAVSGVKSIDCLIFSNAGADTTHGWALLPVGISYGTKFQYPPGKALPANDSKAYKGAPPLIISDGERLYAVTAGSNVTVTLHGR